MLELWEIQSILSLPSLLGPLWPRVVASDSIQSMSQIKLFWHLNWNQNRIQRVKNIWNHWFNRISTPFGGYLMPIYDSFFKSLITIINIFSMVYFIFLNCTFSSITNFPRLCCFINSNSILIFLNRFIWPIDETLRDINTAGQSVHGNNSNEAVHHTLHIFRIGAWPSGSF